MSLALSLQRCSCSLHAVDTLSMMSSKPVPACLALSLFGPGQYVPPKMGSRSGVTKTFSLSRVLVCAPGYISHLGNLRPTSSSVRSLQEVHILPIDIWPLFSIDFDWNEVLVEQLCDSRIVEGLVGHDMAVIRFSLGIRCIDAVVGTHHQWQALYPMLTKSNRFVFFASSNVSGVHSCHAVGLSM